jgi:hypothetical protein
MMRTIILALALSVASGTAFAQKGRDAPISEARRYVEGTASNYVRGSGCYVEGKRQFRVGVINSHRQRPIRVSYEIKRVTVGIVLGATEGEVVVAPRKTVWVGCAAGKDFVQIIDAEFVSPQ